MKVTAATRFPDDNRAKTILAEVAEARKLIETAPASDCYESSHSRILTRSQDNLVGGQIHHVSWMGAPDKVAACVNDGETTVQLSSETFKKDTSGVQAAAAGIGGLVGALLGSGDDKPSGGSILLGAVLGLAAWGTAKTMADGPGEQRVERVETTPTGITTEKVTVDKDGSISYTSHWNRIGAPPVFDAEKAKKEIENMKLG